MLKLLYRRNFGTLPTTPIDIPVSAQTDRLIVGVDTSVKKASWDSAGTICQRYLSPTGWVESTPINVKLGAPQSIEIVPMGNYQIRFRPRSWLRDIDISISQDVAVIEPHIHDLVDVEGLQTALDGKASTVHAHGISDVTGLQTALDGKASTVHAHGISDVTGLQTALDGKALSVHAHGISDVTGLQTALDGKASNVLWMPFVHGGSIGIRFTANSADPTYCFALPIGATIVSLVINGAVSTLNNSTNYWRWGGVGTPAIRHGNGGVSLHSFSASDFSTATWAINTAAQIEIPVNKVASFGFFDVRPAQWIRVGSPGELFLGMGVRYRL